MKVNEIKRNVYQAIESGDVSFSALELFIGKDGVVPKECELWDYKENFCGEKSDYYKLVKIIVSFYNSYGGFLIFGVKENKKDQDFDVVGIDEDIIDQQKLRGAFDKFLSRRIDVTYIEHSVGERIIGMLHIPKRPYGVNSSSMLGDANDSRGKAIFFQDDTLFRDVDECRSASKEDDFEFLVSERNYYDVLDGKKTRRKLFTAHNLPDKDIICSSFVGRTEILKKLWAWLDDEFQYAKVLAGEGGKGKTSIAYEFSRLIVSTGMSNFENVLWLTAKKKQFKAGLDYYVDTQETHFYDLESLLKIICIETGALEDEISDMSVQRLKRLAKSNLDSIHTFVVIDDVDSAELDEQKRIMESARDIANSNSKLLLTTRANISYSSDTSITVPGLSGEEFQDLVQNIFESLSLKVSPFNNKQIKRLEDVSGGSPLFTESILRLCKIGYSLDKALTEWAGEKGETVRSAALKREIEQLSPDARKALLIASYIGSCSLTEIKLLAEVEDRQLDDAITELDNLFLIKALPIIQDEPRFEVSNNTASLVLALKNDIVPQADSLIGFVKRKMQESTSSGSGRTKTEVGSAIRQATFALKDKNYIKARSTIRALLSKKHYVGNKDLLLMKAKIEFHDPQSEPNIVRIAFNEAYMAGQRKELLFKLWYELENELDHFSDMNDICKMAITEGGFNTLSWYYKYSESNFNLAKKSVDFSRKIELLVQAYENVTKAIKLIRKGGVGKYHSISKEIVDEIWEVSLANEQYVTGLNAMVNAIDAGDVRTLNYRRASDAVKFLYQRFTGLMRANANSRVQKSSQENYYTAREKFKGVLETLDDNRIDLYNELNNKVFVVPDKKKSPQ